MAHAPANPNAAHDAHDDEHHDHVVPLWLLGGVFVALLFLTVVTVAVSEAELGDIALFVAMVVATVKASLVCLFFMHLWWDSLFNGIALIAAFVFVTLFIGGSILDSGEYKPRQTSYNYVHPALKPVKADTPPAHGEPGHNHETDHAPAGADSDDKPAPSSEPGS